MGRRKKGRPISGWIILDKDYDVGSTEAVSKIRWLYQAQKAGHAGTLDPLATGILPIALGEATKTVPYVMEARKTYRFTARWGEATNTDDVEGEIIATSDHRPERADIEDILEDYIGEIEQTPPQFSAVKIKGQRAYDLARAGDEVKIEPRWITIHSLKLIDMPDQDHAIFEAETGKGTYVRALVRDIAEDLGTKGHIKDLRRTAVGPFTQENALTVTDIEKLEGQERDDLIAGLDLALTGLPATSLDGPQAMRIQRGQEAIVSASQAKGIRVDNVGFVETVFATMHGQPVAICSLDGLKLRPVRVFNLVD